MTAVRGAAAASAQQGLTRPAPTGVPTSSASRQRRRQGGRLPLRQGLRAARLDRSIPSWRADLIRFNGSSYVPASPSSQTITTAWYGESGKGGAAGRAGVNSPDGSQTFLQNFLDAWWQGRTADLSSFASAAALAQFEPNRVGWASYTLNWQPSCALDAVGSGTCGIALISPEGGGVSYSVHYRRKPTGFTITGFDFLGGGA